MSTLEERTEMVDKAEKAGYHISYIVCIIEQLVDFSKAVKGKSLEEKENMLDQHRWLGTASFKHNDRHKRWLESI